ncbi:MAG: exosortase/archaeosortase family protein [Candidatus Curtissbacteria bacterium]|nr:exosortase/archaeosortase family protein [Candidatus Curtissbacteria bacterium]
MKTSVFSNIFIFAAVILLIFPAVMTLSEAMTKVIEHLYLYKIIQNYVVPYETKLVWGFLNLIGIDMTITKTGLISQNASIYISWNCLGWQSVVLLILTFATGLSGKFTPISRIETVLIGLLGTFLINIFRIIIVVLFALSFGKSGAYVFHNYLATLVAILWFLAFWWFAYTFVLEEKRKE